MLGFPRKRGTLRDLYGDTDDAVILVTAGMAEKPIFSDQATENPADDWFGYRSDVRGTIESLVSQQLGGPAL